jgi:hypothetical protein
MDLQTQSRIRTDSGIRQLDETRVSEITLLSDGLTRTHQHERHAGRQM